jgi:hypothetical protein
MFSKWRANAFGKCQHDIATKYIKIQGTYSANGVRAAMKYGIKQFYTAKINASYNIFFRHWRKIN